MNRNGVFTIRTIGRQGQSRHIQVKGHLGGLPRRFDVINERWIGHGIGAHHRLGAAKVSLIGGRRMIESVAAWIADEPYLLAQPAVAPMNQP